MLKKFIAAACTLTAMGFVLALATADANQGSSESSRTSTTTTATADERMTPTEGGETYSSTASSKWKDAKTCTGADGVTYHRGKKGYDRCVSERTRAKKNEQMSGATGTESTEHMESPPVPSDSAAENR